MNNKKRDRLRKALSLISEATDIVSDVLYEERDCLDNMPENLSSSERYEAMENAIDNLENAVDHLSEASEAIGETL